MSHLDFIQNFNMKIEVNKMEEKTIFEVENYSTEDTEEFREKLEFKDKSEALKYYNSLSLIIRSIIKSL